MRREPNLISYCLFLFFREGLSGFGAKEITQTCIQQHFEDFGLEPQFSTYGKIRGLSGGQKIKTVLASAMWGNPHMLILDEPTNYLDRESLAAFAEAIKNFEGGVVIISHHAEFLSELCSEHWNMENGVLTIGGKAAAVEEEDNNNMSSSMISEDGQSVTSSLGSGDLLNNDASSNGSVSVKAGGSEGGSSTVLVDDNVDKLMNQKGPIGGKVLGKNGKPMSRKQLKELAYEQELDRLIALGIMPPRK